MSHERITRKVQQMDEQGITQSITAVAEQPAPESVTPKSRKPAPVVSQKQTIHVAGPEKRDVGPVDEDSLPNEQGVGFQATSAIWVEDDPLGDTPAKKVEEKKQDVAPKGQAAEPEKKEQQELLGGKFKSVEDALASYTALEAKFTQQAQELAGLKQSAPAATDEPEYTVPQIDVDDALAEELFANPKSAVNKIVAKAVDAALKGVSAKDAKKSRADQVNEVRTWFKDKHPTLVGNLKAAQAIEGLAANAEGSTFLEKFQNATKDFLALTGAAAAQAKADATAAAAETEKQVDAATMPESRKASGEGKKVWRQSDIDYLMEHDRAAYQKHAFDIAQARREGRVREDL